MSDITITGNQPLSRRDRREQQVHGTLPDPAPAPRPRVAPVRRAGSLLNRFVRALVALAFVAAGVLCFVYERELRFVETEIQAWIMNSAGLAETAVSSVNNGIPAITFHANDTWISLRLIPQCSIAMYVGAVLLLSAILIMVPRVRPVRLFAALAISGAGLILLNQARLLVNAVMFAEGGREAFNWAHGPIGSAMMMIGVAGSLAVFFLLCIRRAKSTGPAAAVDQAAPAEQPEGRA
ncbi:exosortase R [Leucobacter sp. HNU]|uniref:exosortase R n=1 Tax=Leucobacter sp. HNU TaxID=3236805 RepID=UPI003A813A2A